MNTRTILLYAAVIIALLISTTAIIISRANDAPKPAPEQIAAATDQQPRGGWGRGWGRGRDNDDPNRPPRGERMGDGPGRPGGPPPFWRGRGQDEMMRRMDEMRRENPELAELHESIRRQELKIRTAVKELPPDKANEPDEEVAAILRPLFDEMFALDIKRQQMEIHLLQEKLDRLKLFLEKKIEHKNRFIEMLVERAPQHILNDKKGGRRFRGWGPPPGPPPGAMPFDDEMLKEDLPKEN
ncbi:MAG: hypothetical protein P9L94_09135 [Candidatus Hinthialibacter antarcticus]|nr:hypothetical protein [Candidatus Hinthialibacter antarcticus]